MSEEKPKEEKKGDGKGCRNPACTKTHLKGCPGRPLGDHVVVSGRKGLQNKPHNGLDFLSFWCFLGGWMAPVPAEAPQLQKGCPETRFLLLFHTLWVSG